MWKHCVLQDQLEEASDGLEAAARLSEQLDRKEEAIDALREEGWFNRTFLVLLQKQKFVANVSLLIKPSLEEISTFEHSYSRSNIF